MSTAPKAFGTFLFAFMLLVLAFVFAPTQATAIAMTPPSSAYFSLAPIPTGNALNAGGGMDTFGLGTDLDENGILETLGQTYGYSSLRMCGPDFICRELLGIAGMLRTKVMVSIAVLAVFAVGLLALYGKVTWVQGLMVALGIAGTFGAPSIVAWLGGVDSAGTQTGVDPISITFATIANTILSSTGRAVGVCAVMILGVGALFGKLQWKQALMLAAGMGMVFGGMNLVSMTWYGFGDSQLKAGGCVLGNTAPATMIPIPIIPLGLPVGLTLSIPAPPVISWGSILGLIGGVENGRDPCLGFFALIHAMNGEMGISIATVAIMVCGFMAMLGRLTWTRALVLAIGMACIFGAGFMANILISPIDPCTTLSSDPFSQVFCGFIADLQGNVGRMIATLAIIVVGILALLGKVSWELGFIVSIGIALIFGAGAIVELFNQSFTEINCTMDPITPPSTGNAIADLLCYILMILYGPAGKAMATIAVIMMGFGALMGKVSFSQAFIVATGIAVAFGAPTIVGTLMYVPLEGCPLPIGIGGSVSLGPVTIGAGVGSAGFDAGISVEVGNRGNC